MVWWERKGTDEFGCVLNGLGGGECLEISGIAWESDAQDREHGRGGRLIKETGSCDVFDRVNQPQKNGGMTKNGGEKVGQT